MFQFIKPLAMSSLLSVSLLFAVGAHAETPAEAPAYIGQHVSTADDIAAITKVSEDFRTAIIKKDSKLLSTLMLNSNILFSSAASPEVIKHANEKIDVNFDGLFSGGLADFSQFIGTSKVPLEEKFYNMKITQDGHMAWVMFDYEFQESGKTENYGVENWQLIKSGNGSWKIISVVWSSHPVAAPQGTVKGN